ncbi:MYG1 family protein [Alkalicella caledoniensis]|uniref:MYG1 family protein n=2 Tax=Alkalicella caledoniensis TaxID=2731377 RepID=A0A7G9WDA4_ALKCA|nr:MYG1 family protein [Alkalicella caledoniensis]
MATAILKELYQVEVIRTRDEEILSKQDLVYDVGGGEFDHHGIEKVYRDDGTPYAASGLVWAKFGKEVISYIEPKLDSEEVEEVFQFIDRVLIKGIDALDNGLRPEKSDIRLLSIVSIISNFNPQWDSEKSEYEAFNEAVELASIVLKNTIEQRLSVLRAKEIVIKAYENRESPEILVLDVLCPYDETLRDIDENHEVLFVVYPRKDSYALQTIRGRGGKDKKPLPEEWAGKENEELASITGVDDAIFCHTGRFIVVAQSFEGIMELAKIALKEKDKQIKKEQNKSRFRLSVRFSNR